MNDEINVILARIVPYQFFPALKEGVTEVRNALILLRESPLEEVELKKLLDTLNQMLLKNISIEFNKIIKKTKDFIDFKLKVYQADKEELVASVLLSSDRSDSLRFFPFPTQESWEDVQKHLEYQS